MTVSLSPATSMPVRSCIATVPNRSLCESRAATGGPASTGKVAGWADRLRELDVDEMVMAGDEVDARFVCPGDAESPTQLDDLGGSRWQRRSSRWPTVRVIGHGAGTCASSPRRASPSWVPGRPRPTASMSRATSPSAAPSKGGRWRPAAPTASMRPRIEVPWQPIGPPSASWRADRPGSTQPGTLRCCDASSNTDVWSARRRRAAPPAGAVPRPQPTHRRPDPRHVVVEAALRSGSLDTARWADDLLRPVMGVPGPVTSTASRGVHELLRVAALLVTAADEVIEQLSPAGTGWAVHREEEPRPADALSRDTRQVLDAVPRPRPPRRIDRPRRRPAPARCRRAPSVAG